MNWADSILYNIRYKKFVSKSDVDDKYLSTVVKTFLAEDDRFYLTEQKKFSFSSLINGSIGIHIGVNNGESSRYTTFTAKIYDSSQNMVGSGKYTFDLTNGYHGLMFDFPVTAFETYTISIASTTTDSYISNTYLFGKIEDKPELYIE